MLTKLYLKLNEAQSKALLEHNVIPMSEVGRGGVITLVSRINSPDDQSTKVIELSFPEEEIKEFHIPVLDNLANIYKIPAEKIILAEKRVLSDEAIIEDIVNKLPYYWAARAQETLEAYLLKMVDKGEEIGFYKTQALKRVKKIL